LVNLERRVFGKITLKEVIGAEPPLEDLRKSLVSQFQMLQNSLDSKNKDELKQLLKDQVESEKETNSRPGAMALAQDKIQLLVEFSQKYISEINKKLS